MLAGLYSLGAHGIMTLNDFKAIEGDRIMGVRSLPVQLGADGAARVACLTMALPQVVVIALLLAWGRPWHAAIVAALLAGQAVLMRRFLASADRAGALVLGVRRAPLRLSACWRAPSPCAHSRESA